MNPRFQRTNSSGFVWRFWRKEERATSWGGGRLFSEMIVSITQFQIVVVSHLWLEYYLSHRSLVGQSFWFHMIWGLRAVGSIWLTSSTWWQFQHLPNSSKIWLKVLSIALEEELKSLTLFNGQTIIVLSCLTVFLAAFSHCSKFIFQIKFFYRQELGREHRGGVGICPGKTPQVSTQLRFESQFANCWFYIHG